MYDIDLQHKKAYGPYALENLVGEGGGGGGGERLLYDSWCRDFCVNSIGDFVYISVRLVF